MQSRPLSGAMEFGLALVNMTVNDVTRIRKSPLELQHYDSEVRKRGELVVEALVQCTNAL